mgnify:CR=1 FL=1
MIKERMTKEIAEECAEQIVTEAVAYNKIAMNMKNLWIGKILDHWIIQESKQEQLPEEDRNYYNLFQHSKVMDEVKNLNMNNGIGSLLNFLSNVDNSRVDRVPETKPELENKIDFAGLWDKCNERDKLTFFKRHDESKCPTGTKYVARKYYIEKGLNHSEYMRW